MTRSRSAGLFEELEAEGRAQLRKEGIGESDMVFRRDADMQFRMQIHKIQMPLNSGDFNQATASALPVRFAET